MSVRMYFNAPLVSKQESREGGIEIEGERRIWRQRTGGREKDLREREREGGRAKDLETERGEGERRIYGRERGGREREREVALM